MARLGRDRRRRAEVVVVTGASAGIGRAIVREFARHGAWVGLVARGRAGLDGARREVEAAGGRALALPADVSDPDQVERAAGAVEEHLGPIDVWINNAMVSVLSPAQDMTAAEYRRVTEVTYLGYVHGTLAALRRMRPRDAGTIVQIGSALAYRAIPLQSAYCGAKHAVQGFTESLRCELFHDGSRIHLTTVQLPAVNTPQFSWIRTRMPRHPQPLPPMYQPEVVARAVYWAAHHRRRELTIGLSAVQAIVGDKFIPGLLDRYLGRIGYAAQQTGDRIDPNRPDNLYDPVPDDRGAHGVFDRRACAHSLHAWANMHRAWLALAGIGLGASWWAARRASRATAEPSSAHPSVSKQRSLV